MADTARARPEVREVLDEARAIIGDRAVREIAMFGAVALMVDDSMAVAVFTASHCSYGCAMTRMPRCWQNPMRHARTWASGRWG
ncbi:hypothetical protein [Microbacterium oleivorans]|uniref:hypothetical protein n=1 Tax=Microbacterium oleivorans TaxID=273677 RepID=UPI00204057E2|nr:hypothetical protein [Microbacterium oleivorans]MCM3697634.1 hypothetical protein [Microbacterium oleivorans]